MSGRREFIKKSIIGATGFAARGIRYPAKFTVPETGDKIVERIRELSPKVILEEELYRDNPEGQTAGPMWSNGSTCLVRMRNHLFASGHEGINGAKPLNNCRWTLFERSQEGWKKVLTDNEGRTREPSPIAAFYDGRLFLSANPTLTEPDTYGGPARPEILQFNPSESLTKYKKLLPVWAKNPSFTEHSYRSFASDGDSNELLIMHNIGWTHSVWSFLDKTGKWSAQGELVWPWGAEYEVPKPIRICYPNVMLKDRAVFFCGVSDIEEPVKAWREYKEQIKYGGSKYDFRRLFYTWSDDITTGKFHPWIEISSREKTSGWITPADLWADNNGNVHLLWIERAIDEVLREKFFPDLKQSYSLNYAIINNGKVEARRTLVLADEGVSDEIPERARFQIEPGNRLFVVYYVKGKDSAGNPAGQNRVMEIFRNGLQSKSVVIPLQYPISNFYTATVRAGCKPSSTLDLLGLPEGEGNTMRYAQVQLL